MWRPIVLILCLLIYATGQDYQHPSDHDQDYHHPSDHDLYDYSISIDSNALYGLRRPDGPDNEDIVCDEATEVHIDGVWFGYQDYQKIPMCHQDKLSQDCLFNLTSSTLDCHNGSCKFPQLSDKDDIPSPCLTGLRYWHVCYSCLSTHPALAHVSEDQPVAEYDEYYYYDYDYETPHTTYRFDVGGNEDLTCESEHHHLVVESVKYGFDKEVIKDHRYEDGDSDCVVDFTNEFVHKLCTRTQCKSPMLEDLKKYNVGKNCKEKALLGMWEIIYICQENQDSQYDDLQDIVESHDKIDGEPVESEDNLEEKDYINPVVSEVGEILDPVGIESEIKFEPEVENVEKFEEENKKKIKPLEKERKNILNPVKAKNEVNPDVINVEIEEDLLAEIEEDILAVKNEEKMDPIDLVNEVNLNPKEVKNDKALNLVGMENEDGVDLVNMETEGNLNLVEVNNETILNLIESGNDKNHNPIKIENQMEFHSNENENKKILEPIKENEIVKFSQVDVKHEDKLVLKDEDSVQPIKIHPEILIHESDIESIENGNKMSIIKDNPEAKANKINAELYPANKNRQQVENIINEDKIELSKVQSGHELNFIRNNNIINLEENQDRQLSNVVKIKDRQNSQPVVSQHLVNIEPNLSSVIPTIEIVSSTEKADKWESTSINPVTVQTKASKQDVQQLQRNANIKLITATETPSIIDEMSSYSKNDNNIPHEQEKKDDEYESSGIISWFNLRNNNKIDQTTTVRRKSQGKLRSRLGEHSNKILMDGDASTTPQPEVTDRVVQKQVNRHHVSKHIEGATKSTTKRAANPTDATNINSHDEKMKQDKEVPVNRKNDGLLSWFSFSKPSSNEPDKPEEDFSIEPDISQDSQNNIHSPIHTTKSQAITTQISTVSDNDYDPTIRYQADIEKVTSRVTEITQETTKVYQKDHSNSHEISVEPTKASDVEVTKESIIKGDDYSYDNFEPLKISEIKSYNSIAGKDLINFKAGMRHVDKGIENRNQGKEYPDGIKIKPVDPMNESEEISSSKNDIQHKAILIDPTSAVINYKLVPEDLEKNKQDYIQLSPSSVVVNHQREHMNHSGNQLEIDNKKDDQQDFISYDPMPTTIKHQFVYNNQRDDQQNYQHNDSIFTTIKPHLLIDDQKHDQQDPLQIDQIIAIINQENVQQNEEEQNFISFEPGMQENLEQPIRHQHGNEKKDPTFIIHHNSIKKIQQINNDQEQNKVDPNLDDNPISFAPNKERNDKITKHHNVEYDSIDLVHHKPVPIDEADSEKKVNFPTLSTMSTLPTKPTLTTLKDNLKENMHQKVEPTNKIDLEEKIILKAYIDGQKNHEHDLSHQNLTDSLPETKISVNEIINNTSNKLSQSLNHEKPNSVKILKVGLNTNFTNSDKEKIPILQATSNVKKIDADSDKPTTIKIDIPDIPLMTHKRIPTKDPLSEYSSTSSIPVTKTPHVNREKISTKPSVTMTTTQKMSTTNIVNTKRTYLPTTKRSTLPTTTKNEVTTTSKPDKKDFNSSNTTSFLPSKRKPSDPFLFSIEDTNDEKQYNSNVNDQKQQHYDNENVQQKNLAKNNSPHLKGDNELEEEDASVKVSWFSTTPDNLDSETEKDTTEITTEVYTEIDVIVGDLLYGDKDISFDQTKLLSSHVKIDQVEILHFVEETEREIASDIDHLKHDLDNLLDLDESMKDFPEIVQEIAKERVEDFFKSMSVSMKKVKLGSILQGPRTMSHTTEDSKPSEETNAASNLLNVTADISEKLSKTLEIGSKIDIDLPDIAMTVRKKSLCTNSSSRWESKAVEVNLPDQESIAGSDSTITVSFTAYDNLGTMMALNENFSSSVLSINVIGVEGAEKSIKLTKPLEFKLAHNSLTREEERSCVYWDFARSSWSNEGCAPMVSTSTTNSTTCECHHLTNFAILIGMHGIASHEDHKPFLDILTNIGCLISMTGLILCILIYSTFRSAKNERSTINVNLCMCLLLSELIFMFGIGQTHSPGLCAVISAVLHYIFLASFFWMLIAGFQIYVLLVEVFEVDGSRFVHYYLLGYIAPLIIVLFSLLFDTLLNDVSVYGTDKYCWMSYGLHLGISFLCPLSLVMTANLYFLVVAFHKFHVHSMDMIKLKSRKSSIKTYLNGLFGLLFLLGVSWSIGLISLIFPSIVLSYTFTVLNSLQGFFIFFFNCIGNNKIRNEGSRKVREAMACLFNINLRRRLSRNSSTISDTKTTDVKEYFMPDNHYCVNYSEGDKRQYKRLPQVARDVTYYY